MMRPFGRSNFTWAWFFAFCAKEFGWTFAQTGELSIQQVTLLLRGYTMLQEESSQQTAGAESPFGFSDGAHSQSALRYIGPDADRVSAIYASARRKRKGR